MHSWTCTKSQALRAAEVPIDLPPIPVRPERKTIRAAARDLTLPGLTPIIGAMSNRIDETILDDRKRAVLHAVIREYVLRAEPVGSRALVDSYLEGISSATVRNEMSALEDLGYLTQPHTSAGRIPTEQGYRYYVDSMLDQDVLAATQQTDPTQEFVSDRLHAINRQVEEVLQDVSFILSRLTNLMAVTMSRSSPKRTVCRVDLVRLQEKRLLVVVVSSDGEVERAPFRLTEELTGSEIRALEDFLASNLIGESAASIDRTLRSAADIEALKVRAAGHLPSSHLLQLALKLIEVVGTLVTVNETGRLYVDGTNFMLGQPEFSQAGKAQQVFSVLEERSRLLSLVQDMLSTQQVVIMIGSELAELSVECSFVGAPYSLSGGGSGAIGILGPTRMNYARAVSAVTTVARDLSDII